MRKRSRGGGFATQFLSAAAANALAAIPAQLPASAAALWCVLLLLLLCLTTE